VELYAMLIGAVLTGLGTGIATIIRAARGTRQKVDDAAKVNATKLDTITTLLVDGRYAEVLQQLADVRWLLAEATGLSGDRTQANLAQSVASSQREVVSRSRGTASEAEGCNGVGPMIERQGGDDH
jgi:hypothetical protein